EHLLEAELFGYEKGAFTGATSQKLGKFEFAHGGTILLDEIGEMVPLVQAKLLRVLQEQEVDRLGGRKPIAIDVRVIATTNKDLKTLVRAGTFREDLYYRLDVIRLGIPPLRRRRDDVVLLADYFCEKYGIENAGRKMELSPESIDLISRHDWPGNVRDLPAVLNWNWGKPVDKVFFEDSSMRLIEHSLDLAVQRQGLISSNLANVDTPGYKTVDVHFEQELRQAMNTQPVLTVTNARHISTTLDGHNGASPDEVEGLPQ